MWHISDDNVLVLNALDSSLNMTDITQSSALQALEGRISFITNYVTYISVKVIPGEAGFRTDIFQI